MCTAYLSTLLLEYKSHRVEIENRDTCAFSETLHDSARGAAASHLSTSYSRLRSTTGFRSSPWHQTKTALETCALAAAT